jgi:hypothetical protein
MGGHRQRMRERERERERTNERSSSSSFSSTSTHPPLLLLPHRHPPDNDFSMHAFNSYSFTSRLPPSLAYHLV